ncbi:hypothetical protein [Salmonirosea aquatica]|uniref:Uncharacterized protein n=1 Tax=Salmonirosea aquatica TaxID=2654236 RepID=A0A7C9BF96_9BACT|nr:hypothetical protein [Cytophagaceae bacterium SJW1-29]
MKRVLILGTLFLLMLNTLGYYPVYLAMQWKAQTEMKSRLDAHLFEEDELFTIKIPIGLPYWTETRQAPERIDGQIEYNGDFYKLYKQEVIADTLVVLAVKDHSEKALFTALTEWVKITVTGLPGTSEKAAGQVSHLIKEYFANQHQTYFYLYDWLTDQANLPDFISSSPSAYLKVPNPPPDLIG